jgi:hypothetical protein
MRILIILSKSRLMQKKEHWRGVLKRINACVQYLAEYNDDFRATCSKVYTKNNGEFLGLIEMISKFDTLMVEHPMRISRKEISDHYLGWKIQNELIDLMSKKIKEEIKS